MILQPLYTCRQLRLLAKQINLVFLLQAEVLNGVVRKNDVYPGMDNLTACFTHLLQLLCPDFLHCGRLRFWLWL